MIYHDTSDHSVICTSVQMWMKLVDVDWRCDSWLPAEQEGLILSTTERFDDLCYTASV